MKQWKLYSYVMSAFAVILVLSNTAATKLVPFGPFVWTSAILIFPVTYILGDVITEVYGFAGARRIFWVGLIANCAMALVYAGTSRLPALDLQFGEQYATVLEQVPRIVIASMCGVWCGQFSNAWVMSRMKVLTGGRWLWSRTISSTLVGETVDTAVFALLGFAGIVPPIVLWQMIYSAAIFKTLYETIITPVTYVVVTWMKRFEGAEAFDLDANYNPFGRSHDGSAMHT